MKIPGVTSVVAGVTGGAAQIVKAGVSTAAGAAGAVQLLASPVVELAGPVVQSMANSTGRALGINISPNGSPDLIAPPVRWQSGQRVHLDLDPLLPFSRWYEYSAVVEEPVRRIPGVAKAHVESSLGRLVVELSDDADNDAVVDDVRSTVAAIAADLTSSKSESAPRTAPFADPANPLAILVPLTAAAMDMVAITAAVTGWVTRLPAAPQTTRAAAALLNHQPRMVSILESRLGRVGTDITLAAATAAANGLTQAVGHTAARSGATDPANLRGGRASARVARPRAAAGLHRPAAGSGGPGHLLSRGQVAGAAAQLGGGSGG